MKLIDANKLWQRFDIAELFHDRRDRHIVHEVIEKAPVVDAVQVVRCKNCIHYDFGVCLKIYSDGAVSQYAWQARKEDDFCSYGERTDNEKS